MEYAATPIMLHPLLNMRHNGQDTGSAYRDFRVLESNRPYTFTARRHVSPKKVQVITPFSMIWSRQFEIKKITLTI